MERLQLTDKFKREAFGLSGQAAMAPENESKVWKIGGKKTYSSPSNHPSSNTHTQTQAYLSPIVTHPSVSDKILASITQQ